MEEPTVILVPAGYGHPRHRLVIRALMERTPSSLLVDCRLVPRSRWPAWSQPALQRDYDQRYQHVPALGNRRYRVRGQIEIVDLQAGVQQVVRAVVQGRRQVLILLCGCAQEQHCHRRLIVPALEEALQRAGVFTWKLVPEQWAAHGGLVSGLVKGGKEQGKTIPRLSKEEPHEQS